MQHIISVIGPFVPLLVFFNALISQGGLPFPVLPTFMIAGALAGGTVDLGEVIVPGVIGALLGDLVPYWCGRRFGRRALGLICKLSVSPDTCVRQSETVFTRIGPRVLLFVKFIPGLSQISVVMAGLTRTPTALFVLFDTAGTILFVGSLVLVGHLFRDAIGNVLATLGDLGKYGILLVVAALGLYLAGKWWRRQMFIRQLRMDRITIAELRKLIDDGEKPVILDVRSDAARADGVIPGAIFAHPHDVEATALDVPPDREIVIYCSCPNEASAAIAAQHLRKAGFQKIRPLLGGIDAWVSAGETLEHPRLSEDQPLAGSRVAA